MTFHFVAQDVPGCGYQDLLPDGRRRTRWRPRSLPPGQKQLRLSLPTVHMENEFLAVDIDPADGTLTVRDKAQGQPSPVCTASWMAGTAATSTTTAHLKRTSSSRRPRCRPRLPGSRMALRAGRCRFEQTLRLPVGLGSDRSGRSQEMVEVPITSQISLYPGVPRLDFRTEVDNRARDHRLRVHFPSPVHTDWSEAESTFDVVRRPLGVPADTGEWVEQPVPTHPQKTFVDVSDGAAGLMVINRGLPEYEVLREADGSVTVALTLLRCVGWLSRDDYPCRKGHAGPALETPEAQCLGHHVFEYAIVPHAGNWRVVYPEAHAFNAPLRAVSTDSHTGPCHWLRA